VTDSRKHEKYDALIHSCRALPPLRTAVAHPCDETSLRGAVDAHGAAAIRHLTSALAGDADLLLVPDLEAGNMLAKEMTFLANADAAGIVLGARVPIILTSRADNVPTGS
jgi:hypothetical protein